MLAPLRGTRADYSLMLEKYGNMNFFPCQAKSGQSGPNRTWQALSGVCALVVLCGGAVALKRKK